MVITDPDVKTSIADPFVWLRHHAGRIYVHARNASVNQSELIEVSVVSSEANNLIIEGTIMGAMPIRAVLTPTELRSAFRLLNLKTIFFAIGMLFKKG